MKKPHFLALLALAGSMTSAHAMFVQAQCDFNAAQGQCTVYNQWSTPILCELAAQGQVSSGAWINESGYAMIYPGSYGYVYVYAMNPAIDPLIYVAGSANCSF